MKIKNVDIVNFRSIARIEFDFENGCEILLGINESGKSNILRALGSISADFAPSKSDIRLEKMNEDPIDASYVRFVFTFSAEEKKEVAAAVAKKFSPGAENEVVALVEGKEFTLSEYAEFISEGLYRVDFKEERRYSTTWARPRTHEVVEGWGKVVGSEPVLLSREPNDEPVNYPGVQFISKGWRISGGNVQPMSIGTLRDVIGGEVKKVVEKRLPNCVFWQYKEENMLPASLDIDQFGANPDICVPLKNMFLLAGYAEDSIASVISQARASGGFRYHHLLEKVATKTNRQLRRLWPEHKAINITLHESGSMLYPFIKDDQIPLPMQMRSDGFKRLVSFLLLISVRVRNKKMQDTILLVDEPEIGLHPGGARSLMRELIEIGATNYVVFATHSIFMVDRENIGRHYIVEKKREVTVASRATTSRIHDEEVLFNAVGFSMFEMLKRKNIIFEGWRDKRLFEVGRDIYARRNEEVRGKLFSFGLTFAEGVKDVRNVTKILDLAGRSCLIISDADAAGNQHKKEYENQGGHGKWITYADIFGAGGRHSTGEDFVRPDSIVGKVQAIGEKYGLRELRQEEFIAGRSRLSVLEGWVREVTARDADRTKHILSELKEAVFSELSEEDIDEEYLRVIEYALGFEWPIEEAAPDNVVKLIA